MYEPGEFWSTPGQHFQMEKAIKDALFDWPLAPAVDRLQAQHGAITAVARELVGFMWAIARMEPMEA